MSSPGQINTTPFQEKRTVPLIIGATVYDGMRKLLLIITSLLLALAAISCSSSQAGESSITVFAAASLADVMEELSETFREEAGVKVSYSLGGSQILAQQIIRGAPADVFISADELAMERMDSKGLLEPGTRANLLTNELVLIVPSDDGSSIETLEQLGEPDVGRIAIADPELAPAGRYAKEALVSLGLWEKVEGKLILGADVRITLAYLTSGNSDAAIVYRTDVQLSRGAKVMEVVPQESHSTVEYPVALMKSAKETGAPERFVAFLKGDIATGIFQKYGFRPLSSDR